MLSEHAISVADRYWAGHLGCAPDELFAEPVRHLIHGGELAGYGGVFALFRGDAAMVSFPPDCVPGILLRLSDLFPHYTPEGLAAALSPVASRVIGPAWIGYAEEIGPAGHPARVLGPEDSAALHSLQQACDATEWEHGGSAIENVCSGGFVNGQLIALAGYEVWGGTIAHISIITHPGFRSHGYGRSAVAHAARQALATGLLPQYRTLESNLASIRIAASLGFHTYATSMAVRLNPFGLDDVLEDMREFMSSGDEGPLTVATRLYDGDLPLHVAAIRSDEKAVRVLLDHGADACSKGERNSTPLHYAASRNNKAIIEMLLAAGASPFVNDEFDWTPIDDCESEELRELMRNYRLQ